MEYQGKKLRQELKYAINDLEYACLRSTLLKLIKADEHVGASGEYHIRSLYFDNGTDDAYNEKESGDFQRGKYRIRVYNESDAVIHLELKEKFGQSTAKTSQTISLDMYHEILNNRLRFPAVKGNPFLSAFYLKTQVEQLRPKVIVDYVREPYVCEAGNVRITFDKELRVVINNVDIFASNLIVATPQAYGSMILEVKYDDFLPGFISSRLRLSQFQRLAISKYTICREMKSALNWKEKPL